MAESSVSNRDLYNSLDRVRVELKSDIIRLENKFDMLEAGRLTRLEGQVNRQQIAQATASTKLAVLGFISSSIIGALISALAYRIFGVH